MMISFVLHSHFHFPPSPLLPSLCISLSVPHSFSLSLLLTLCVSFCCHLALLSFVTVAVVVGVGVAVACGMWHSVRHFAIFIYGMQLLDASPLPRPLPASLLLLLLSPVRGHASAWPTTCVILLPISPATIILT